MNENKNNSIISVQESKECLQRDVALSTENVNKQEDVRATTWSTYEIFSWFYSYTKMFTKRMIRDMLISLLGYIYSGQIIPKHIAELISVQKSFVNERESQSITYRRIQELKIPSYPGSLRSLEFGTTQSLESLHTTNDYRTPKLQRAVDFLHAQSDFIEAAKIGDVEKLEELINFGGSLWRIYNGYITCADKKTKRMFQNPQCIWGYEFRPTVRQRSLSKEFHITTIQLFLQCSLIRSNGTTNIHQMDHIGRNALHFAICAGNRKAVSLLLKAGVDPNVRDSMGQTPLSLCLSRCPSAMLVRLLFKRGAVILPRGNIMDTGIFFQFIMFCTPTEEEEEIIYLLVEQGALINDPDAPGGRQALHLAAMSNNCQLIMILVTLGANLYLTNINNQTPKEYALTFKCKEAYAFLGDLEEKYVDAVSYISGRSSFNTRPENSSTSSRFIS